MTTRVLKYLTLLAFLLVIVAISSFWFGQPSFSEKNVVLELEGPTQISAGDEVIYTVKYENNTRSTLNDLEFFFVYPEGSATIVDGEVGNDYSDSFKIDSLGPGEKGEKEFSAFLLGERGNIKVAKLTMSFSAGTLRSSFEKTTSLSTTIIKAPISLALKTPPSAVSGGSVNYILDYRNESDGSVSDMIIEFDFPEGFSAKGFSPDPDQSNNTWIIDSLDKGDSGKISINGTLTGREGENKVVSAVLKRKLSGDYIDYQRSSSATVISNPILDVEVLANGSTDYSAALGSRINYIIKYKNNSNFNLFGMDLTLKLEGEMFDLSTLDTRGGFFDDSTKTITWNSSTIPEFSNFAPFQGGEIRVFVGLKTAFASPIPGASQDRLVKATARFGTPNVPTSVNADAIYTSNSLVTKISTEPTFNQTLYYNDPEFGASGPFPLEAGQETYFTVHWDLINSGNDTNNIKVTAQLSPGVEWVDQTKVTAGQNPPTFNPNASIIEWKLDRLPYGIGVFTEKYSAVFRIKIKPSTIQQGALVNLFEDVRFVGIDNYTKQDIIMLKGTLSSNDTIDQARRGVVQ